MNRRSAIVAVCAVALAAARSMAQSTARMAKVTMVVASYDGDAAGFRAVWLPLFKEHGFTEGSNLALTPVKLHDLPDKEREQAARTVVEARPDIILVTGTPMSLLFQKLTRNIPIVFTVGDPVRTGLVTSLNRPGGNLTGIANLSADLDGKRLELLKELRPNLKRVAVLVTESSAAKFGDPVLAATSSRLGIQLVELVLASNASAEKVAQVLQDARVDGVIFLMSYDLATQPQLHAQLLRLGLPATFPYPDAVDQGGLIYYGVNMSDLDKRFVAIAVRILRGESSATIPVEQPSTYTLTINLRTARALGITIPNSVRLRTDQVVE